jgi:hypothetical protein
VDVVRENPADYIARYGGTLLDSATLLHQAHNAGVHEDLVKSFFENIFRKTNIQIFLL